MSDRRILNTWKEIAAYLQRSVRTVQRWELSYNLPIHRPGNDTPSVFALSNELDEWLARARPRHSPYVRPTFIVLDAITPTAISQLKLTLEGFKFNVLTAFTSAEMLATAERYDVDGFVVDSIVLDADPRELGRELRSRYPAKPRLMVGDEQSEHYDVVIPAGRSQLVVDWLIERFGVPKLADPVGEQDLEAAR